MKNEASKLVRTLVVYLGVLGSLSVFTGFLMVEMAISSSSPGSASTSLLSLNSPDADAPDDKYGATVEINNLLKFDPPEVTIKAGQAVLWKNISFVSHTVTADPALAADKSHVMLPDGAEPFNSLLIDPDINWSKTFTVPGRYRYFCIPHEATGMVGEVVVEPN